jgi:hypothetical protein
MSSAYGEQLRELSEHAAVADASVRRLEGELRETEARALRCLKCDAWVGLRSAQLAEGRCTSCHRLLEHFR